MAGWRYLAQHPVTQDFLDLEVPLSGVRLTRRLSGPWGMEATITPEVLRLTGPDGSRLLDEWRVQVWAECDGVIRGGGILTRSTVLPSSWALTFEGHLRYPYGLPYTGSYSRTDVDAFDVVRHLWEHVQGFPDGDLGLVVDAGRLGVLLGTETEKVTRKRRGGGTRQVEVPVPYRLDWWDTPDVGDVLETLAREAGFEYAEAHAWAPDGEQVEHRLRLAERMGRRRTDIAFVEGENLAVAPGVERDGETFAQYVLGLGSGEGRKRRSTGVVGSADGRLRRAHVLERPDVGSLESLRRLTAAEQRARRVLGAIPEVAVTEHPNAPLGSWEIGDEVEVHLRDGWQHESVWCRIVEDTITPETADAAARLRLTRADAI